MTTILATATALTLAILYVAQVRKRGAAEQTHDHTRCQLAATRIRLHNLGALALTHAVAAEQAETERDNLHAAYLRLDAEFGRPANVVKLPAKRRVGRKVGAK